MYKNFVLALMLMQIGSNLYSQNQISENGFLTGLILSNAINLNSENNITIGQRILSTPNNQRKRIGFKIGYFDTRLLANKFYLSLEPSLNFNKIHFDYKIETLSTELAGFSSIKSGPIKIFDISINTPFDIRYNIFNNFSLITGLSFKYIFYNHSKWESNKITYIQNPNNIFGEFKWIENIEINKFNLGLRYGISYLLAKHKIRFEFIIKHELEECLKQEPNFKRNYESIILKKLL